MSGKYSCPFCGADLEEHFSWRYLALVALVLGIAMVAKRLLTPLISWELLVAGLVVVAIHHLLWIIRRRREKTAKDGQPDSGQRSGGAVRP